MYFTHLKKLKNNLHFFWKFQINYLSLQRRVIKRTLAQRAETGETDASFMGRRLRSAMSKAYSCPAFPKSARHKLTMNINRLRLGG